jgi:hypothetical protein
MFWVLCAATALFAVLTVIASILARVEYPPGRDPERQAAPQSEQDARSRELPSIRVRKANPREVSPSIGTADARTNELLKLLRDRRQEHYAAVGSPADEVSARLRIVDAWDLRYMSATRRAPRKRWYLTRGFTSFS